MQQLHVSSTLSKLPGEVVRRPVVFCDDALQGEGRALFQPQVGRGQDLRPLLPPLLTPSGAATYSRLNVPTSEIDQAGRAYVKYIL